MERDPAAGPAQEESKAALAEMGPEDPAPAAWPCPACDTRNPLELDACQACGTPFGKLFEEPRRPRRSIDPVSAMVSSLMLPGLGHIRVGRVMEGVARLVLFLWAAGVGALIVLARPASGLGPLAPMAVLFIAAGVTVYAVSAADASRAANDLPQLLSPRGLLYGSAAMVILSMISMFVVVLRATRVH